MYNESKQNFDIINDKTSLIKNEYHNLRNENESTNKNNDSNVFSNLINSNNKYASLNQ
jgi:hypothetical protein